MLAWELKAFDLDSLTLVERPAPEPGPGQVVVEIAAVSLNYRDLAIARGVYAPGQPLPLIPASDAAGRVVGVGEGVTRWGAGDRVIGCYMQSWDRGPSTADDRIHTLGSPLDGVLCRRRVFPEGFLVAAPEHLSDLECATLPIAALTAWCALMEAGGARPGETVLVQGSGGVSTFATQIAAAAGLRVIAVSRSAQKLATSAALGADALIDSTQTPRWGAAAFDALEGRGADIILDVGGEATLAQSLRAAAQNGRIVSIGYLGGLTPQLDLGLLITKNLSLRGITVGSRSSFEALLRFLARSGIRPLIDRVFAFEDAPAAFRRLADGGQHGKVCIDLQAAA
ncbi:MAG: NAD(P)-dependent alcohol dehydrogenase [Phenylobacterium sp.]